MAIKLKNLRNKLALLLLVSGLTCILGGVGLFAYMRIYMNWEYGVDIGNDIPHYQETTKFKEFMEKRLATFLSMAMYGNSISIYSLDETQNKNSAENLYFNSMPYDEKYQNKNYLFAGRYNEIIENDKNIVYKVIKDDDVLYTNYTSEDSLSGYNFRLEYEKGRVNIKKDDKWIDIYGDKIYTDGDWYVPGYRNFQDNLYDYNIKVVIYAIENPTYFSGVMEKYRVESAAEYYNRDRRKKYISLSTDDEGWFAVNELYYIDSGLLEMIHAREYWQFFAAAGMVLLAAAFVVAVGRKYKIPIRYAAGFVEYLFRKDFGADYTSKNRKNFIIFILVDVIALMGCMVSAVMVAAELWNIYAGVTVGAAFLLLLAFVAYIYMNVMGEDMSKAVDDSLKNERMKIELVTNVSHDIKTPLTSIISYIKLLKEEDLPDYIMDYVNIIDNKSERLKSIVGDVFEISKASSGQLPVEMKCIDFGRLISQTVADMEEAINKSGITIIKNFPEKAFYIMADGSRLYRVIQNLIQNTLRYSLSGSKVHILLTEENNTVTASIANTSKDIIPDSIDFTERFVRGDASRTDGGSGLGLSIAKSFTEVCGGTFKIETYFDKFIAKVSFRIVPDQGTDV